MPQLACAIFIGSHHQYKYSIWAMDTGATGHVKIRRQLSFILVRVHFAKILL